MNVRTILYRYLAFFVQVSFLITAAGCGATPSTEPTPPEVVTMTTNPVSAIPQVSIPLTGEWCFSIDKDQVGEAQGWANPNFDDSSWAIVQVPHTWNVMPDYSEYEGVGWYRKTFVIPSESQDTHLRLRFEAVYYLARVWLNGQYLGQHEGGYTLFEFDVTSIAKPGSENVIAVQVDNLRATNRIPVVIRPDWSFDWWNYGGIRAMYRLR